jgi:hypothetical protein
MPSDCYNWAAIDNDMIAYIRASVGLSGNNFNNGCAGGRACKFILIINAEQDKANGVTTVPTYVFQPSWASNAPGGPYPPQDVAACSDWPGAISTVWPQNLPCTGTSGTCNFTSKNQGVVWNIGKCLSFGLGAPSCNSSGSYTNLSGFPVVYEGPILMAYQQLIKAIQVHYSPAGSGSGPTIAPYIAYIRVGLAAGGENNPGCVAGDDSTVTNGVLSDTFWPGPKGITVPSELNCFTQCGYLTNWPGTTQNNLTCTNTSSCSVSLATDGDGYVTAMDKFLGTLFSGTIPVTTSSHGGPPANSTQPYADAEALEASLNRVGFGMQTARISDQSAHAIGQPATQNWVVNFARYAAPVHHLQAVQNGTNPEAASFGISTITISGSTATANCTGSTGTVNTSGTAVTWVSGSLFDAGWTGTFTIAGTGYTISSVNSTTSITLTASAPTQSGVAYDASNSCEIYSGATIFISNNSNSALNGQQTVTCTPCSPGTIQFTTSSSSGGIGGQLWAPDYWPSLFPFLTQHRTSSIELRACELDYAFGCGAPGNACTSNTGVTSLPCGGNYGPDASYQSALANFVNGIPTATSVITGKAKVAGTGSSQ